MRNPATDEPPVIPLKQESSLLDWLQTNGRLIARDVHEPDYSDEEEEISEFLSTDDGISDFDYDDDDDVVPDEE